MRKTAFEYVNSFSSNVSEFKRLIDDDLERIQSDMQEALYNAKYLIARMSLWLKENESKVKTFLETK